MWDFSWLERRWPGAGFEDWDTAFDELVARGYDTVRIDAYPHLLAADADRTWRLLPQWNQQSWGAQSVVDVRPFPALIDFIRTAAAHGVDVALSTWFRKDVDDTRMQLREPADLGRAWIATLDTIVAAGLAGSIAYVDLCNEFPLPIWAPFLSGTTEGDPLPFDDAQISNWMTESIAVVRAAHPGFDYTFSFVGYLHDFRKADVQSFDLLEPHLWMASTTDYYDRVGYHFEFFSSSGYDNLVERGRSVYEQDRDRYDAAILQQIDLAADWSRATGKPLATTECWSIVDYKDWPGLDWDWVKDLNERALTYAAGTGRWVALASSNFCAPQFVGMWRDVDYHRRLTEVARSASIDADLLALRR